MSRLELVGYLVAVFAGVGFGCGSRSGLAVDAAAGIPGTSGGSSPGRQVGVGGATSPVNAGSGGGGAADSPGQSGTGFGDGGSLVAFSRGLGRRRWRPGRADQASRTRTSAVKLAGWRRAAERPTFAAVRGWMAGRFPARSRCCPLDGMTSCIALPSVDGGTSPAFGACTLPCGPEGHSASGTDLGTCGNEASQLPCVYCCSGNGCSSNVCHRPEQGPGSPPCMCNTPALAVPVLIGWRAPALQVDLCCRAGADGSSECFSRSVAVSFVEGFSSFSGPTGCDVYRAMDGHVSEISCDGTKASACTCTVDGVTTNPTANVCDLSSCGVHP